MVKIRLRRMGARKQPVYRIVVVNSRAPRDGGKVIDWLGSYSPMTEPAQIKIDAEKVSKWLKNGAQPTDSVRLLFKRSGIQTTSGSTVVSASNVG